jgi:hypothetical protein
MQNDNTYRQLFILGVFILLSGVFLSSVLVSLNREIRKFEKVVVKKELNDGNINLHTRRFFFRIGKKFFCTEESIHFDVLKELTIRDRDDYQLGLVTEFSSGTKVMYLAIWDYLTLLNFPHSAVSSEKHF